MTDECAWCESGFHDSAVHDAEEYDLTDLRSYAELADGLAFSHRKRDDEIRRARKHGIKLEDLADAAGVDQSRISRICKEQE